MSPPLEPRTWAEITSAYEEGMRLVDAAFTGKGQPCPRPAGATAAAPPAPDLEALYTRLCQRLGELDAALTRDFGPDDARLAPLMFFFDEQIEKRLAGGAADAFVYCHKLQHCLGVTDGGDEFYVRARALERQQPPAAPVLVALYLLCLRAGFQGRYFDKPTAVEQLEHDLEALLGPAPVAPAAPSSPTFSRARSTLQYLVAAAFAVVAVQIVLLAIARAM